MLLADKSIAGFKVNKARVNQALAMNPILVTALNPVIGYEKGAATAKQAYKQHRPIMDVALETTGLVAGRTEEAARSADADPRRHPRLTPGLSVSGATPRRLG